MTPNRYRFRFRLGVLGGLALALGLQAWAVAAANQPEDTVIEFYRHISKGECDAAAGLSIGYSAERCRAIEFLRAPAKITRVGGHYGAESFVIVSYRVEFSRVEDGGKAQCNRVDRLKLVPKKGRWLIDWSSIIARNCSEPSESPTLEARPDPDGRRAPAEAAPSSPVIEPGPPPPMVEKTVEREAPAKGEAQDFEGLLRTWPQEELLGWPGSERIIPVQPPDTIPPAITNPKGKLPGVEGVYANSIRRVRLPKNQKLVALTFDLCEQADDRTGYDRNIVNFLRARRIPATFFAGGKWMRSHEDKALQLMADPRFEIGNHGWTHGNLRVLKGQPMLDQIVWTQAEYGSTVGGEE